jgi:hypothetical protein
LLSVERAEFQRFEYEQDFRACHNIVTILGLPAEITYYFIAAFKRFLF